MRPVPAVVRRLEEHRLPELVVAPVARDCYVSHAAAAPGGLPGRLADARLPAHLRLAGPQLVTERAALWLVLEQRSGHLDDHALTSLIASTITAESMMMVTWELKPPPGNQLGVLWTASPTVPSSMTPTWPASVPHDDHHVVIVDSAHPDAAPIHGPAA
jgi:hypothetical protein